MATKFASKRELTSDDRNLIGSATKMLEELIQTTQSSVAVNRNIIAKNRAYLKTLQASGLPLSSILPLADNGQAVTDVS